ncbi:MAG: CPBP family intramembrane metalloprotease [Clostridia bacterium]|nr:CPBP family intramembrane metalloprotease [Clostridia bacterium]
MIFSQTAGMIAVVLIMYRFGLKLFKKLQNWLYLLPCLLIAVDNFPFYSYFQGNMRFVDRSLSSVLLFAGYCLVIGMFEECVFRGLIFSILAGYFSKDKAGLIKTFVISSVLFGLAHIFNVFGGNVGGTLLQVGYTTLTGGLFAFALIKTKNVLCCGIIHAVYNFCGLLLSEQGLGGGIVFDLGTGIIMAVISVCVAVFVFYSLYTYKEDELTVLYSRLGIKIPEKQENEAKNNV